MVLVGSNTDLGSKVWGLGFDVPSMGVCRRILGLWARGRSSRGYSMDTYF